jgi:hypothetical protein
VAVPAQPRNQFPLHNPSPEKITGKMNADRELENNAINQPQIQLTQY